MADIKPIEPKFKFDEEKFKEAVAKQTEYLRSFAGKELHNPFPALALLEDLNNQYLKGNRTEALYNSVVNTKLTPPVVCKAQEGPNATEVSKVIAKAQAGAMSTNK